VLTPTSPIHRRLWAYLQERFPPVAYTLLVALFFGSAVLVARAWDVSSPVPPLSWLGGVVVWLAFLHLRLMDESKDFEQDVATHPERVLSRGIVTLPLLKRLLIIVLVAEAVLAALLGPTALLWWGAALAYSLAMWAEFGVGSWLSKHIVLYAITHNPVVALLALFAHGATGVAWDNRFIWYLLMVSFGSLAFEIGRKMRTPDEEVAGVETYSSALGRGRAGWLLRLVILLAAAFGGLAIMAVGSATPWTIVGMTLLWAGALLAYWAAGPATPSKRVDGACSVFLLLSFIGAGMSAW
jgi:hypothetical protein